MQKYGVHPSNKLVKLFSDRPYQGQTPAKAKILIIGNDANYHPELCEHDFFERVLEYHQDAVKFWEKYGVHHPFLLNTYPLDSRKGGVRYHSNFRKLGFDAEDAKSISFIELLNVPTIGNTGSDINEFIRLIDPAHLKWLDQLIFEDTEKFVLVNQTLARLIKKLSLKFRELKRLADVLSNKQALSKIYCSNGSVIFNGYSFSAAIEDKYLHSLSIQMREFIDG